MDFQDGGHGSHGSHLVFLIRMISAIFDLCHPSASYQVLSQLAFVSDEEGKNRVSRWRQWQPSWISDRNDFSYF